MRIVSQTGLLDAPYELIAISPYSGNMATIIGTFPGNDLGKGDRVYILAEYSTEEKAIKAMEMCREKLGVANEIYRISCWKSSNQGQELTGRSYGEVGKTGRC